MSIRKINNRTTEKEKLSTAASKLIMNAVVSRVFSHLRTILEETLLFLSD